MSASARSIDPMSPSTAQRICEEAFRLFSEQGYAGTSVREIAAATGVSPGVLTYHFPKKSDLFAAAIEGPYDRMLVAMREQSAPDGRPALQRLLDLLRFMSHPPAETLALLRLLIRQVLTAPEPLEGMVPTFVRGHFAVLGDLITEAQQAGELPDGVGLGLLPLCFGGAIMPALIRDALASRAPAAEPMLRVMHEQAVTTLFLLLGVKEP